MRYRLRTLVILTAIGPPVLAALWFAPSQIPPEAVGLGYFLLGLFIGMSMMASVVAVPLLLAWLCSLIARLLLYLLVHPDNRP